MIKQAFGILGRSVLLVWDNLLVLTLANVVWALSLIPTLATLSFVPGFVGIILGVVLGAIFIGPSSLAFFVLTTEVTRQERLDFSEYIRGIRQYYKRGWLIGAINGVFGLLALFNLAFYGSPQLASSFFSVGIVLWGYVAFMWFTMQIYMWPLAVRLEKVTLGSLLRNSFLATFKYAGVTLIVGLFMAILLYLSLWVSFLPVILIGMAYYAVVCNKAVTLVLEREATRIATAGDKPSPYQVEIPPLPSKPDDAAEAAFYTTRNAPPGVKKRGLPSDTTDS